MSDPGSPNPFEGFPLFGDLAKLLGQGGQGVPWDAARSLAVAVATDNQSEPNVDPLERMKLEQLARVAELHVAKLTGLSTTVTGRGLTVLPVNRGHWAQRTLEDYRPLLEKLAGSLGSPDIGGLGGPGATGAGAGGSELDLTEESDLGLGADPDDQFAAMLGPMIQAMQPMMVAMTAGSMVGHLARRSFGQYDLPIPRTPSDELLILVPNLDEFGSEWSLPADDLRLWICLHEIAHHTVLAVPHVRQCLERLLTRYATSFRTDPRALEEHLGDLDLTGGPESMASSLQQVLGEPGALLGAIQSDEQRSLLPQLEATVAVVVGVVDHVMDEVGAKFISSYGMLTEALRRRRVETSDADRFVERLLGLELTQATYDRGARFVEGVIQRAGPEGLGRLWEGERMLPSPPEVDAPGLWLARIDLPDLPAE